MTDSANEHAPTKVVDMLEDILVELDNRQLSLPAIKIAEALELLSKKMDDSVTE